MDNLFVTNKAWELMRYLFTEPQKVQLRKAKSGEMICPPGVMVDADQLPADLKSLLHRAIKAANKKLSNKDKR